MSFVDFGEIAFADEILVLIDIVFDLFASLSMNA